MPILQLSQAVRNHGVSKNETASNANICKTLPHRPFSLAANRRDFYFRRLRFRLFLAVEAVRKAQSPFYA